MRFVLNHSDYKICFGDRLVFYSILHQSKVQCYFDSMKFFFLSEILFTFVFGLIGINIKIVENNAFYADLRLLLVLKGIYFRIYLSHVEVESILAYNNQRLV